MIEWILVVLLMACLCFYRNELTYRYSTYWSDLIYQYNRWCINNNAYAQTLTYEVIMSYERYFLRVFDFNKDNMIIDKDVLAKLKAFKGEAGYEHGVTGIY